MTLSIQDIEQAAARLAGHIVATPLLSSPTLNQMSGARLWFKAENLQHTGAFKLRGALNRLLQLTEAEKHNGVVAWSSGNHAQGIAAAAKIVNTHATIVMPKDAPATKIAGTRAWGADIVFYNRQTESREVIARALADQQQAVLVPSFDDYAVMAGQGTCGLELADQAAALRVNLSAVIIPCGGGGLAAGVGTALRDRSPATRIELAEPCQFDDHARSLRHSRRESNEPGARSICDALLAPTPGELTFPINQSLVARVQTVTDTQVEAAIRLAHQHLKLVVEPGGAVGLAAVLNNSNTYAGEDVAIILSGGNIDQVDLLNILNKGADS